MYVTLEEARRHLNLDEWFTDDDTLIEEYIEAAEDAVEKRIDRPLAECVDSEGRLSRSVRQQILLLTASFYSNREAAGSQNIKAYPLAFEFLADLNRKPSVG